MVQIKCENIESYLFFILLVLVNGFLADEPVKSKAGPWEKVYPNGTIVGQYHYKDKFGNPVHIHYYADDSNYGVEVNSVKIIKPPNKDTFNTSTPTFAITKDKKRAPVQKRTQSATSKHLQSKHKAKTAILHYLNKETRKNKHRSQKHDSEYETYTLSNIEGLKQRTDKRVRVYNMMPTKRDSNSTYEEFTETVVPAQY